MKSKGIIGLIFVLVLLLTTAAVGCGNSGTPGTTSKPTQVATSSKLRILSRIAQPLNSMG
jgi:hypothetical protein